MWTIVNGHFPVLEISDRYGLLLFRTRCNQHASLRRYTNLVDNIITSPLTVALRFLIEGLRNGNSLWNVVTGSAGIRMMSKLVYPPVLALLHTHQNEIKVNCCIRHLIFNSANLALVSVGPISISSVTSSLKLKKLWDPTTPNQINHILVLNVLSCSWWSNVKIVKDVFVSFSFVIRYSLELRITNAFNCLHSFAVLKTTKSLQTHFTVAALRIVSTVTCIWCVSIDYMLSKNKEHIRRSSLSLSSSPWLMVTGLVFLLLLPSFDESLLLHWSQHPVNQSF